VGHQGTAHLRSGVRGTGKGEQKQKNGKKREKLQTKGQVYQSIARVQSWGVTLVESLNGKIIVGDVKRRVVAVGSGEEGLCWLLGRWVRRSEV